MLAVKPRHNKGPSHHWGDSVQPTSGIYNTSLVSETEFILCVITSPPITLHFTQCSTWTFMCAHVRVHHWSSAFRGSFQDSAPRIAPNFPTPLCGPCHSCHFCSSVSRAALSLHLVLSSPLQLLHLPHLLGKSLIIHPPSDALLSSCSERPPMPSSTVSNSDQTFEGSKC